MLTFATKVSIKIRPNIENYGKYLKKTLLERRRKRRKKMAKKNDSI